LVDILEDGDRLAVALIAGGGEEPELVLEKRPTDGAVDIPDLLHQLRRRESRRFDPAGEVARLKAVVGAIGKERAREPVATLARHQVHRRAADLRLAESS